MIHWTLKDLERLWKPASSIRAGGFHRDLHVSLSAFLELTNPVFLEENNTIGDNYHVTIP